MFNLSIFEFISQVYKQNQNESLNSPSYSINGVDSSHSRDSLNLEKDIFVTLSGLKRLHVFKTTKFWSSIKSAGSAIYANRHYLDMYRENNIDRLATNGPNKPKIIGDVFIHPSANVHPTSVLGPNVSIGRNVTVSAGVRVRESIILGNTVLQEHCCILYSIIGWNSFIGCWARIEGK